MYCTKLGKCQSVIYSLFAEAGVHRMPCYEDYNGKSPFSEIEVRNIKEFSERLRGKIVLFFDIHAYSQMILLPLAYDHRKPYRNEREIVSVLDITRRSTQCL